jgi:small subunit ribosomal protein S13
MRISGVTIPSNKKLFVALGYLYGIGLTRSVEILKLVKIDQEKRVKDLTQEEEDKIRTIIEKQYKTEGDLRREVAANIKRLKDIKCYRGTRHMKHLPTRGQRTKTNSRTVRGNKRNIAASGKKPSAQKT